MEVVTSKDNSQVKLAAGLLASRKIREETGCFVAEGLRLCQDAAASGVRISAVLVTQRALDRHPRAAELEKCGARFLLIPEQAAAKIADTKNTQGVFAVCEMLDIHRRAVTIKSGGRYLLLSQIQDPGNLGAMLRTADAMGMNGVFLSGGCADLYAPKVLRSAMGGIFRLPVSVDCDLRREICALQAEGTPVFAAALRDDGVSLEQADFSEGGGVLIGNEGNGLEESLIDACAHSVRIPMAEGANSLNAAVAAGILLWELCRGKSR